MKKKFKFKVLGLILALCCVFAISTSSFKAVEVKATEGEIVEEEKGETYTYKCDEGEASITLYNDGTCYVWAKDYEIGEEISETLEYFMLDETTLILTVPEGNDHLWVTIDKETMTFEEYISEENPETTPEIPEELPELGFFEEYLHDILASAIGVLASIAAFFLLVMRAKKNVLDTLDAFKGGKISQEQANDSIKKEIEELKKAKEELLKEFKVGKDHLEETSENVKKYVDDCEKLITNVNTKIDNLTECFLLMANNNSTLVRKGVSEEINKRLKGGAGVEKPQKL